jgi:hypothetical protein
LIDTYNWLTKNQSKELQITNLLGSRAAQALAPRVEN